MAVRLAELLQLFDCGAVSWHVDQMRRTQMFLCAELDPHWLGPPHFALQPLATSPAHALHMLALVSHVQSPSAANLAFSDCNKSASAPLIPAFEVNLVH
jgi:hypothetical protein